MNPCRFTCVCSALVLGASLSTSAMGQSPEVPASPVAIVYVSHPSANQLNAPNQIVAYTADAEGKLTRVPGSPFAANVIPMAVTGTYLFGGSYDGSHILSFRVASDGALKQVDSFSAQKDTPGGCNQVIDLVLDHTGAILYSYSGFFGGQGTCPASAEFQSFKIDKSNGALDYLGSTGENPVYGAPLRFIGNDTLAYEGSGLDIFAFKRETNGLLLYDTTTVPSISGADGQSYFPEFVAADPTNHLAVVMQPESNGGLRLASFTVSSNGDLTTSNTEANMAKSASTTPYYSQMSPSGKVFALAGDAGLEVFHFNGANPMTRFATLTTDPIYKMYWDNANHLYAISVGRNKLYVFTVTESGFTQAPGSPYSVFSPVYIAVRATTPAPQ